MVVTGVSMGDYKGYALEGWVSTRVLEELTLIRL